MPTMLISNRPQRVLLKIAELSLKDKLLKAI